MKVSTTRLLLASLCSSVLAAPVTVNANLDVNAIDADANAQVTRGITIDAEAEVAARNIIDNTVQSVTGTTGLGNLANVNGVGNKATSVVGQTGVLAHDGTEATAVVVNSGKLLGADADVKVNARTVDVDAHVLGGKVVNADVKANVDADVATGKLLGTGTNVMADGASGQLVDAQVNVRDVDANAKAVVDQLVDADVDVAANFNTRDVDADATVVVGQLVDADVNADVNVNTRDVDADATVVVGQLAGADVNADVNVNTRDVDADATAVVGQLVDAEVNADVSADVFNGVSVRGVIDGATGSVESTVKSATGVDANGIVGGATQGLNLGDATQGLNLGNL